METNNDNHVSHVNFWKQDLHFTHRIDDVTDVTAIAFRQAFLKQDSHRRRGLNGDSATLFAFRNRWKTLGLLRRFQNSSTSPRVGLLPKAAAFERHRIAGSRTLPSSPNLIFFVIVSMIFA
jgi:hypothetical protein